MTIGEQVADLQQRITTAQRDRARAEGARDAAQAAADTARADLKREFGVESPEQAEKLLTQLRAELEQIIADVSADLDKIGL